MTNNEAAPRYTAVLMNAATGASRVMFGDKIVARCSSLESAQELAEQFNFIEIDLPARRAEKNT